MEVHVCVDNDGCPVKVFTSKESAQAYLEESQICGREYKRAFKELWDKHPAKERADIIGCADTPEFKEFTEQMQEFNREHPYQPVVEDIETYIVE